ncbi:MAG: magnesium transporter CorA family protein [Bacteroidia bacterium]|jgi:magnesium transporter
MITLYRTQNRKLEEIQTPEPGCWINAVDPTEDELSWLLQQFPFSEEYLNDPLDIDEKARAERDDDVLFTLIKIPHFKGKKDEAPFITIPLGVIINNDYIITIAKEENVIIQEFEHNRVKNLHTAKHYQFLLLILFKTAAKFLMHLREINKTVDQIEDDLKESMRNQDIFDLLKYQKVLIYYTTALKSNELMMARLNRLQVIRTYEEDEELFQDVVTEFQQAIEMTNIANNILLQMTTAYASIINNNMNKIIKTLTLITIVLYVPTLIASFFGMNVELPGQQSSSAFAVILGISLALSAGILFIFLRRKWF